MAPYYRPRGPLRECRGTALLLSLNLGTLDGGGWSTPRPGRLYPGKHLVPIVQEDGWASKPVWIGAENLAPTGIRSPNLPAPSESLYRLSHHGSSNPIFTPFIKSLVNQSCSCNGLHRLRRVQEVEAARTFDSRHVKVTRLSALCNGRLYLPGNIRGNHFS